MKVFFVFQSDTPGNTGRRFVRGCLDNAVVQLKTAIKPDIEEPSERESREALHADQGREGVTGIPDLARTIFEKIEQATAVVADVTAVSVVLDEKGEVTKRNPNPNVMVELGYALKAVTDKNILMVMNTHCGGPETLPFDIDKRGWPILFNLPPNASKAVREKEAEKLTEKLVEYLSPILAKQAAEKTSVEEPRFAKAPYTFTRAVYFKPGEILMSFGDERDGDRVDYTYQDGNAFYLRLMPNAMPDRPFRSSDLGWVLTNKMPFALARRQSSFVEVNDFGAIVIQPLSSTTGWIRASTQLFNSGEIWGIASWLLRDQGDAKLIGQDTFEDTYRQVLARYARLMAEEMKLPLPYTVEAGAVGLDGYRVAVGDDANDAVGPIRVPEFNISLELHDLGVATLDQTVIRISEALFRLTGYKRPG
jgi:hypothetical protein